MKRYKRLLILLGVLVLTCTATLIVTHRQTKQEKIQTTGEIILWIAPEEVQSLSWQYGDTQLAFHKDGSWYWDGDEAFPVDEDKLKELLSVFEEFGASFVIEDVEDYDQYGLEDPTCVIRLATENDSYEIKLGAYSTMDSERYVSFGDGNVYLVKHDPFEDYEITLEDTIRHDETPSLQKVRALRFSGGESYTVDYEEDSTATYCENDLYYTERDGVTRPLDTYRVEDYYGAISLLELKNYVSYNATEAELEEYGLKDPELTVSIDYLQTGENSKEESLGTFTLSIGRNRAELAEQQAAEAKGEEYTGTVTAYARVGASQIIYEISESDYKTLRAAGYDDLRHRELLTADFNDVTAFTVTLEDSEYTITAQEDAVDKNGDRVYDYNGEETDLSTLRSKIEALTVTEFCDTKPDGKEEISFVFTLNNENHPEVHLQLYRCDGTNCLAVLDGETIGLVSRSKVMAAVEAMNAIVLG